MTASASCTEGSDLTIEAEVFGDWNYAKAKQGLCENLVLSGKTVDGIWFLGRRDDARLHRRLQAGWQAARPDDRRRQ